jgi:hypothetical protein
MYDSRWMNLIQLVPEKLMLLFGAPFRIWFETIHSPNTVSNGFYLQDYWPGVWV